MDLKGYQKRRDMLCNWYDRVIEQAGLLQADAAALRALRESQSNLRMGRFVVAVCGETNVGKSTLLNALLFGEEVLPADVTTATANITIMEGGSPERLIATLYAQDEFQQIIESSKRSDSARKELNNARSKARAAGLRERDLLRTPPRTESVDGLRDIVRFAAVGGAWSVYVNVVNLVADRPWLHEVTVADTPGVNDPNPIRTEKTREWIRRADAVVYVTDAGQAGMNDADVKFLDRELAHIRPERRIIAVNKCDGSNPSNPEAVWRHINEIRQSDARWAALLRDDDAIVLVSGLGGLIAAMQAEGLGLSEDMEFHVPQLDNEGYLDAERHGLEKLRELIENRIIRNKGAGLIESHRSKLNEVLERAYRQEHNDVDLLKRKLADADKSLDERRKEKDAVGKRIASISEHIKNAREKIERSLEEFRNNLHRTLVTIKGNVVDRIKSDLEDTPVIAEHADEAKWIIGEALYGQRHELIYKIRGGISRIEPVLNSTEMELSEILLLEAGSNERATKTHLLTVSASTICRDAEKRLSDIVDREDLGAIVRESTTLLQRVFDTRKGHRSSIKALVRSLDPRVRECLEGIAGSIVRDLQKLGEDAASSMEQSCQEFLDRRRRDLEALEGQDIATERHKMDIRDKLQQSEGRVSEIKKLYDEYGREVGDRV